MIARGALRVRVLVAAATILFAGAVGLTGYRLIREQEVRFESYRSGSWMLVQAQVEYLRLHEAIDRVRLDDDPALRDELWLRFDIFWSRIPLVLESDEALGVRRISGVVATFEEIDRRLPDWEARLTAALDGPAGGLDGLKQDLEPFREDLGDHVAQVLLRDKSQFEQAPIRRRLTELFAAFVLLCGLGGVLVVLLIIQLRRSERLTGTAREAEAAAEAARARLAEVIDSVDAGITYVDPEGRVAIANRGYARAYPQLEAVLKVGMPFRELLAESLRLGVYDTDLPAEDWLAERLRRPSPDGRSFVQLLGDGRVLLVRERATSDGGVVAVRTDITDVRRAERELAERLEAIEASSDGIAIADADGRLFYISPSYARMQGLARPDEAIGRTWRIFYGPEEQARLTAEGVPVLLREGAWRGEAVARRSDGSEYPLEVFVKRVTGGGVVTVVRDLTEQYRQQAERDALSEQFFRAQKLEAVGRLAGGIAHDFNNILAAILGFGALLEEDLPAGSMERGFAAQIVKAGEHGKDLVQQILAFARTDAAERGAVDLRSIARDAADMLGATLPSTTTLSLDLPDSSFLIDGNQTQLSQVLLNLCVNANDALEERTGELLIALSAMTPGAGADDDVALDGVRIEHDGMRLVEGPERGRVRIRVGHLEPGRYYARLSVRDTGAGIPRAVAERMFDPFYTTKARGQGTGLGLAAVQGIVASHHGALAVDSQPGAGTWFDVFLPLADGTALAPAAPSRSAAQGGHGRVLVVDDEVAVGAQLALRLERLGYEVTACEVPADALAAIEAAPDAFDIVVTDLTMPQMTGNELCAAIHRLVPDLPVILCTGNRNALAAGDSSARGFVRVFGKPVDIVLLSAALNRAMLDRAANKRYDHGRASPISTGALEIGANI